MHTFDIVFRVFITGSFLALLLVYIWPNGKKVDKARCKKTAKAREYQEISKQMPDVVWTQEIYDQTYKF